AYLPFKDELAQESDEEEVFTARDDMEEDTQADAEEHQSPSLNKDKPEPSHIPVTQVSDSDSSSLYLKKSCFSYADLRASIEGHYKENVDHMEQTDKVIDAAINSLDKNSIVRGDLLNALNRVTNTLKVIHNAVKEDPVLNKKVIEATKAYIKNSTHLTELLTLIKNFDFQGLKSSVESLQPHTLQQEEHLASWAKS
ncbi:hypothetical protein Tco_1552767, partial [Tanacetum coccineum]